MIGSLIGIGVFLESNAMQWFGAVMAMFFIIGSMAKAKKQTVTPEKAAQYLYDNFGAKADESKSDVK